MKKLTTLIGLVWLLTMLPALAQTDFQIELAQVDDSEFPRISLYVSVTDGTGQPMGGLSQDEFSVLEDGQQVPILDFAGVGDERPVDVVFVFDTTGSMSNEVEGVKETCIDFAEELESKGRDYRLGLVTFWDEIKGVYRDDGTLTDDVGEFKRWIGAIHPRAGQGDGGPENDLGALKKASQMRFRDEAQRVFILITDAPPHHYGDSSDGGANFDDPDLTAERITAILQEQSVTVYAVAYDHTDFRYIVQETGGHFYDIDREPDFTAIIDEIGGIIASQYRLTYESARPSHDGTRRGIEVKVGESSDTGGYVEKHLLDVRSELLVGTVFLALLLLVGAIPSLWSRKQPPSTVGPPPSLSPSPLSPPSPPPAAPPTWSPPAAPPPMPVASAVACPQCGSVLQPGARFCGRCGASLSSASASSQLPTCPHCGQALRPGIRFCGSCGNRV